MPFKSEALTIPDVKMITPRRHVDVRGYFMETYRESEFAALGISATFVQDNHTTSIARGTLRGLHFQSPPHAQAKLVRVVRGAIFDVAVDLRKGSPTYGNWVGVRLSAEIGEQVFVPRGFAHGYCTLEARTEVVYKCDAYYAAECEGGINCFDPSLGIAWPAPAKEYVLSDRDRELPSFRDFASPFVAGAR